MIGIAVGGVAILGVLGILIGRLVDRQARDSAWDRIALQRRINAARTRELDEQQNRLEELEEHLTAHARCLGSRPTLPID